MVVMPPAAVSSGGGAARSEAPGPIQVRALHHALLMDRRAQEARAIWLQEMEYLFGIELRRFPPALDYGCGR